MIAFLAVCLDKSPKFEAIELLSFDRKKVENSSVVVSNDGKRVAYLDPKREILTVDRKRIGKYIAVSKPVFSSDSKDWAVMVFTDKTKPPSLLINGKTFNLEYPVMRVYAIPEHPGFMYVERDDAANMTRLTLNNVKSEWIQRIDKIRITPDAKSFVLDCSEDIYALQKDPGSTEVKKVKTSTKLYFITSNQGKETRSVTYSNEEGQVLSDAREALYLLPNGSRLEVISQDKPARYLINGRYFTLPGAFAGEPVISSTGRIAIKSEFTGVTEKSNVQMSRYAVDGLPMESLAFQVGFKFYPDGKRFVFGGTKNDRAYIQRGYDQPELITSLPGLEKLPLKELYRWVGFVGDKLALFFQSKTVGPLLWVEDVGAIPISVGKVDPSTISFSPDLSQFAFVAEVGGKISLFRSKVTPGALVEQIGAERFTAQSGEENRPQWLSKNKVQFLGLDGTTLYRVEVTLEE